ncbi:orotidine-5'-phosphate decarboxylase [Kineococcus xinjiangensis]|uniref:Orotidine 5'-phosphate decarboxylase n=1 Tax=Kineococcus xinjiangensis TaxID=512762 RepID=A0A2S6IP44_9ACTN|nr:orotidine-5'-phosphate decarboxylase [Kineococcus xinjiangensis]PPK96034.1 orotidine-5'-phosphate decarboxylase [Kineococcus xinjiangensis]
MTPPGPGGRFGARLAEAVALHGPVCVGIDPHASLLAAWGLDDDVAGLERFSRTVVEALAGRVAALKPQAAFFERHGSRGVAVLETVIAEARAAGTLTIVDAKRGDIGSTMQAYADAFCGDSPLAGDAVTVSPYLGFGSLRPVLDTAAATGRGVFVLALTSNPEGAQVQHATGGDGRSVARAVAEAAAAENAGATPLGDVGLVVGATTGTAAREAGIDLAAVNGPLLAPGVGAQGATAGDLRDVFGDALPAVLAASSRDVLRAGPDVVALREAAERTAAQCRAALGS